MKVTFDIAGSIRSLNFLQRKHWHVRYKIQQQWTEWIGWSPTDTEQRWLRTLAQKKRKMRVTITAYRNRLLDVDNLYGSTGKICLDGLKKSGYLYDDRPEFCTVRVEQVKSSEQKICFEIEECSA